MPEIREEIKPKSMKPVQVDMICPKCGVGRMRPGNTVLTVDPPLYPHKCTECGHQTNYFVRYPYTVFEEIE